MVDPVLPLRDGRALKFTGSNTLSGGTLGRVRPMDERLKESSKLVDRGRELVGRVNRGGWRVLRGLSMGYNE